MPNLHLLIYVGDRVSPWMKFESIDDRICQFAVGCAGGKSKETTIPISRASNREFEWTKLGETRRNLNDTSRLHSSSQPRIILRSSILLVFRSQTLASCDWYLFHNEIAEIVWPTSDRGYDQRWSSFKGQSPPISPLLETPATSGEHEAECAFIRLNKDRHSIHSPSIMLPRAGFSGPFRYRLPCP